MQIVIEMSPEIYQALKEKFDTFSHEWKQWGLQAIYDGTVLPEKHGRLIDADALMYKQTHHGNYYTPFELIDRNDLNNAPTIIEADNESEG